MFFIGLKSLFRLFQSDTPDNPDSQFPSALYEPHPIAPVCDLTEPLIPPLYHLPDSRAKSG